MSEELAYALITPYSLYKSRTGGIIGRLLAYAKLDFVGTPDVRVLRRVHRQVLEDRLPAGLRPGRRQGVARLPRTATSAQSNRWNYVPRCMLLLFRGENAVRHLKEDVIGQFTEQPVGDTVRGTYGDFLRDESGTVHYFEPAVMTCPDPKLNDEHLRLLAEYADSDGGVLTGRVQYDTEPEVSLVMLKPDNFYQRSRRPGNIIDAFSLTGPADRRRPSSST